MYSHHQPQQLSNLSKSLPPTPSQLHPAVLHETDPVPDDYFGESDEVSLPFPIKTIVADPQTGISLTLISALGAGSYAVVYLAKEVASGSLYALKCLSKDRLTEDEVAVQKNEASGNIIHLFNMFETTQHLFLLLEYSSGMDMYQWISMRADRSDPASGEPYSLTTRYVVIKTVFDQVLEGVAQVHQRGIAHRDLKPENFLIEFADGQYIVKITDFGLATTDTESDEFECGSKPYMSFECRNGLEKMYNVQMADIWSLGIILINLLYHRCPWSDPCPQDSYAFSEFLKSRIDFLQGRFEDMPGPVARWLGLRAFAFDSTNKTKWRRTRPTMDEWRKWMVDFVPRMLGQIDSALDDDDEEDYNCEEEYRAYLAYYEDDMLEREVEGDEIEDDDSDKDMDNQVVPIAIQSSSLKDKQHSLLDPGRAYASYHVPGDIRNQHSFTSSSAPKFDSSAFYQPARLRQESWSDAIDMEGTEDAEMDFSAPILFEESEDDDINRIESDDDDSGGLAVALPDDFIDPLPDKSASSSGRQTPTPAMTQFTFNTEKRQLPAHLRFDLESPISPSSQDSAKKAAGRGSPGLENIDINNLVFIEPDVSRLPVDQNQIGSIASSLPSTSHMEAAMSPDSIKNNDRVHLKQHMRKPARNLQDVKAAPFVFPPLKTPTPSNPLMIENHIKEKDMKDVTPQPAPAPRSQPFIDSTPQHTPKTSTTGTAKPGPYVIPKRSQLGPWGGQTQDSGSRTSEPNSFGAGRIFNWRKSHHRGGSWTSTENAREGRRGSATRYTNDGPRTSSGKWRARVEDREDGHVGLPPRVENKFRPRYRQGQGQGQGRRYPPQVGSAALPPTPPIMHMGFGGPRSRHQSRSGAVFDPPATNDPDSRGSLSRDGGLRDAQQPSQDHAPRYENSQLRMNGKPNPGATPSRLAGQRNKSLVDLRGMDATNQPWRQSTGSNEPNSVPQSPLGASTKTRPQNGNGFDSVPRRNGPATHPLEQSFPNPTSTKTRPAEKGLGLADGDAKDNVYHPPHWHERKSVPSGYSNQSRRPSSGYESDVGSRHRHDTSGSLSSLGSLSKSQSGSRGGVRPGAGAGGGYPGLNMTSPPLDRKQGQQRTADTATNWRSMTGTQDSSSRHTKKGSSESGTMSMDSASSSLISLNLSRAEGLGLTDSPSMILTPPTPNVNRKSEFLSDGPVPPVPPIPPMAHENSADGSVAANGEASKKIVKPGAMAGLGNMLRGLVAYNKNIKVAGETTGVPESADLEPRALGASNVNPRSDRDATMDR
ncbi:hypothetical protein EC957_005502 [Mortierella hygrophila]|uniref:non-specific serine/threonine protein kinase n=1 Tax=Mortierella hygrophila TaxID=979708 RepID=A0A9P6FDI4_9FUNG|nr:hypothetical protein EC957_005502 [Mortierella hygrophila]